VDDRLVIAGKTFGSRLIVGTGKYRTPQEMVEAIEASGAQMVTVALKRIDFAGGEKTILDHIDWTRSRRRCTPLGWPAAWACPTG